MSGDGDGRTNPGHRVCALSSDDGRWGLPPIEVQERLRAGFGAALKAERLAAGLSGRALERRALVAGGSVSRWERGLCRPRPTTLEALSRGLDPGDPGPVRARLTEAVGDLIADDTEANRRRRRRIEDAAWRAGRFPLSGRSARLLAAADRVDSLTAAWFGVMNRVVGAPDDTALLDQALHLGAQLREAQRVLDAAGGPILTSYGEHSGRVRFVGAGIAHLH